VPPNLKNPPAGCRFAERCKHVRPDCKAISVGLLDASHDRAYRCILSEQVLRDAYLREAKKNVV
jgi:peptide/nickel transport system ATP-binding protein